MCGPGAATPPGSSISRGPRPRRGRGVALAISQGAALSLSLSASLPLPLSLSLSLSRSLSLSPLPPDHVRGECLTVLWAPADVDGCLIKGTDNAYVWIIHADNTRNWLSSPSAACKNKALPVDGGTINSYPKRHSGVGQYTLDSGDTATACGNEACAGTQPCPLPLPPPLPLALSSPSRARPRAVSLSLSRSLALSFSLSVRLSYIRCMLARFLRTLVS